MLIMNDGLQMIEFDWWLCLTAGMLLFICGIAGIADDIRHKRCWWRWILHLLAMAVGGVFVYWTVV